MSTKESRRFWRMVRRRLLLVFLAALFAGGVYAGYTVWQLTRSYEYDGTLDGKKLDANKSVNDAIINIALFGVDARHGETARSDAMMILTIDGQRGKVKLTSLMRDSYVPIEGHGSDKLCHAHFLGGPELAIRTINQDFGLDVTEYATVNFNQMASIIDAVGGVELDVSEAERKETNKFIREYAQENGLPAQLIKKAGFQNLSGMQAMTYGRIRKGGTGDDWMRAERQSQVLKAIFARVKTLSPTQAIATAKSLMRNVTTSLSVGDITAIATAGLANGMPQIEHTRLPLDGDWQYEKIKGVDYITFDLDKTAKRLHDYIYDDIFPERETAPQTDDLLAQ